VRRIRGALYGSGVIPAQTIIAIRTSLVSEDSVELAKKYGITAKAVDEIRSQRGASLTYRQGYPVPKARLGPQRQNKNINEMKTIPVRQANGDAGLIHNLLQGNRTWIFPPCYRG